ncbi:MAG TPA: hypothetical protein VF510_21905, partial [Ktedonobacterales bacterium]
GDTYTSSYPMPPSPTAEPFIPATSVPATADPPRDRAYTLHLQGYRSPAIAAHLHVPERTIRYWIQHTNQDLNALPALDDLTDTTNAGDATDLAASPLSLWERGQGVRSATLTTLQHQRTLAVERHRARSAAAWALHDQLRATLDPFLARLSERLLLHTQYPDDADHVSMSTLALAGGPLSPAFRAMYHMLPGIIGGLTRSLALAERADLQIDRLLAVTPPPAPKQPPESKAVPKQPTQEETKPLPTSGDFRRAARAQRIAEEDAYVIPRLTKRQRDLIRLYCALPDPLPEGPMETWNIKIDPNAPLTRWREVLLPHGRRLDDPDDLDDDPEDDPDPTPPSGTGGKYSGNKSGKTIGKHSGTQSGNAITAHTPPPSPHGPFPPREGGRGLGKIDNSSGKRSTSPRPHHRASNRPRTTSGGKEAGKDARTDAPTASGNHSGNPGNKIGNDSGNHSGNANDTIPGNDSGNKIGNPQQ